MSRQLFLGEIVKHPFELWLEFLDSEDGMQHRLAGSGDDFDIACLIPTPPGRTIFTVGDLRKLVGDLRSIPRKGRKTMKKDTLTKDMVDKLYDDNISVKEYKRITGLIDDRVDDIWNFIVQSCGGRMSWWSYDNDEYKGGGNGSSGGEFDPVAYKEEIGIEGDHVFSVPVPREFLYYDSFPTSFLWEDYKEIVTKHISDIKDQAEKERAEKLLKKEEKARRRETLLESIKSKLTDEEFDAIMLKK